jgi:hypothetical protein
VNDVETADRRGLHAREAGEMVAWDSLVGHHMGLAHAHQTFTKTFRRISTEEVRELYRNGIVHGTLVNYDNDFVSAKAWIASSRSPTGPRVDGSKLRSRRSAHHGGRSANRWNATARPGESSMSGARAPPWQARMASRRTRWWREAVTTSRLG